MCMRADMGELKKRRKLHKASKLAKVNGDLFSLLPSREEADCLVR